MVIKVDIGCGKLDKAKTERYKRYLNDYDPQEYIGVDRVKLSGVNIVCDIEQGLHFEDGTIDKIIQTYQKCHLLQIFCSS